LLTISAEVETESSAHNFDAAKKNDAGIATARGSELIPERAHQPVSLHTFGKQQCKFCLSWNSKYPWLHCQEADDSVCFYCLVADKRGLGVVRNKSFDDVFTKTGFSNWKKALEV
jgi:hypothetical protein